MSTSTRDLFRLDGRVAIITGGAGLLAEEHARALADHGARIVFTDLRDGPCVERAAALNRELGIEAIGLAANVTDQTSWIEMRDRVLARFGRIDILINNAAFTNQSKSANFNASFADFPVEDFRQILDVNLTGTFLGCQVIGARMVEQKTGSIINMASLYAVVSPNHRMYPGTGIFQPPAYAVSKAGVVGLTRYLAALWAEKGVRVNCITPGGIYNAHKEPFTSRFGALCPMGRMQAKDELRGAAVYLASDASGYCTGHNLVVDGGWTIW